MNRQIEYLTDEELLSLMAEAEADCLPAPPGTEEAVLERLAERERKLRALPVRRKRTAKQELRRCSLQVIASVTAAILLLFGAPAWDTLFPKAESAAQTETYTEYGGFLP